jgi:hypothetical protein
MYDVGFRQMMVNDRIDALRRAGRRPVDVQVAAPKAEISGIELRLCRASDDPALERLAALAERPLPFGRLVVALVNGTLVAALPLGGGCALRDPFAKTVHLLPLLELRASQLRQPQPRRPWPARLVRRHA